jgi:hypothetical protein
MAFGTIESVIAWRAWRFLENRLWQSLELCWGDTATERQIHNFSEGEYSWKSLATARNRLSLASLRGETKRSELSSFYRWDEHTVRWNSISR